MEIQAPIYKYDVQITPERFSNNSDRDSVFLGIRQIMNISHDVKKCIFMKKNPEQISQSENQLAQWILYTNKQMYQGSDVMNIMGHKIDIKQIYENGSPSFVTSNKERLIVLKQLGREIFSKLEYHEFQNGFFNPIDPPNAALSKDKSVVYQTYSWNGVRPETIEFRGKIYLQLETTPVRQLRMNVFDVIKRLQEKNFSKEEIANFFVGRTVKTSYFSQKLYYEILEINYEMTPDSLMPLRKRHTNQEGLMEVETDNEQISFYEYIKKKYRINIRDRIQPMLRVKPLKKGFKSKIGKQDQNENEQNEIYLIPNLCNLFGDISQKGIIDDNIGCDFYYEPIEVYDYLNQINKFLKKSEDVQDLLNIWQIKIGDECEQIGYNYLKLSQMLLRGPNGNEPFSPNDMVCKRLCHEFDGYYKQLLCSNGAFTKFAPVERWNIYVHTSDVPLVEGLISSISQFKLYFGYQIEEPKYFKIDDQSSEVWVETIKNSMSENQPTFVLIILNNKLETYWFYKLCKQIVTVEKGIPCSMIKATTLSQYIPTQPGQQIPVGNSIESFACRFLVQMQAKLGESPWLIQNLPFNQNPATMIGYSVIRQKNSRKIIVGASMSVNKQYSKYQSDFRVISEVFVTQNNGEQNIIEQTEDEILNQITNAIKEMTQNFLQTFNSLHKTNPTWVIVIRDGAILHNAENEKNALYSMLSTRRSQTENKSFHLLFSTSLYSTSFRTFNFSGSSELNANNQNVYSTGTGTIIEKNFNKREFYLYTSKIIKNCPFAVLYNVLHIDKFIGLDEQSLLADFQDLIYNTYILNYTYHTKTISPACLQNAYKIAEFVKMFVNPAGSSQHTVDLSNLRPLSANYKLFFI